MKATRKKHAPAFKARVAIEALKERETLAELSRKFEVHQAMISRWKQEFLDRSPEIFSSSPPEENFEVEREKLYAKIGQLEVECDWLKKISKRASL